MKPNEVVKTLMEENEVRMCVMCDRTGIKSNNFSNMMKRENLNTDTLVEMLKALDCKLVVVPRDTRIQSGWKEVN